MARTATSLGADTFAFFTRNPRGGGIKALDRNDIDAFRQLAEDAGIEVVVAHGAYTVNPCAAKKQVRDFAFQALTEDLERMEYLPHQLFNIHPGSHVGQGIDKGVDLIADVLNDVLRSEYTTTLLLETMAGKGSEVGSRFEEIAAIIDRVELKEKVGVCLDTCHVWDAGYDIVGDLEGVVGHFDEVIGLDKLKALHVNDSLNACGSHKDRHARIGEGAIGSDALLALLRHPALGHLPCILETPNDLAGYASEIAFFHDHL